MSEANQVNEANQNPSLTEKSLRGFAEALAAKEPVPGGGGAAALCGAVAAALCSMVCNYTVGKKTYAAVEDDIRVLLDEAESARTRMLELIDGDALAFVPLSRAYAIPKDDPARADVLEQATKGAIEAPLEMAELAARIVDIAAELEEKGSRMLTSDAVCAGVLARAALECAVENVKVNTAALADRAFADPIDARCDALLGIQGVDHG